MIFVSTGGYSRLDCYEVVTSFIDAGFKSLELSGGVNTPDLLARLSRLKKVSRCEFQLHNYFPPPSMPFVLNLGSLNDDIGRKSFELARTALEWSSELQSERYAVHAGFCLDPQVHQLGADLNSASLYSKADVVSRFRDRIFELSRIAKSLGVELLVENNVITKRNLNIYGVNPLLMCEPQSIKDTLQGISDVRLLLDLAHLKVSANTLGFDLTKAHETLKSIVGAYHISDNDSISDSNKPITYESWFLDSLAEVNSYTLEVYDASHDLLREQVSILGTKI